VICVRSTFLFRCAFGVGVVAALAAAACGSDSRGFADDVPAVDAGQAKKDGASTADGASLEPDAASDADADAWPTCDAKPATAVARSVPEIWQADPAVATETWVADAYVTAISGSSCSANKACQIFLQADLSYSSLASAAKHGIKLFISAATASHFTAVRVGDRVDVLGWAWRYNLDVQHELLMQVTVMNRGCAKTKSSGNALVPLSGVTLSDLTLDAYENTHGPLFVHVASVLGKPDPSPTTTFGLFHATDSGFFDAGADAGADIVSLSPFFLPSSSFTGFSPALTAFASITGVFGTFVPAGGPKYLELYPRTMSDVVVQ
jgi:hypothetical protein